MGRYKENDGELDMLFKDVDQNLVRQLAIAGHTDAFMADAVGTARNTWKRWKVDYPLFADSLDVWKKIADDKVKRALYKRAIGMKYTESKVHKQKGRIVKEEISNKHSLPDVKACDLWLGNRDPNWQGSKSKMELDVSNDREAKYKDSVEDIIAQVTEEPSKKK